MAFNDKDWQLIEGLKQNNKIAIENIYRENFNMVQTLIINNKGTYDDALDVFQESIIVLFEKIKSDHFSLQCRLSTYLYAVAKRLWLKKLNNKRINISINDDSLENYFVDDDIQKHEEKELQFEQLSKGLIQLGEPCKSILEAFYIYKNSMPEIAEKFGYTNAENAKTQKYKCLLRLKKIFFANTKNIEL